ncbi:SGNH/GDSL hydrolase family protein [Bosea sp. 124]|uniref:SGNH/GDSL hydrolase family protein n=1 Tax=Bosea sp. 124 TaxID=2135642 RepID=UPI000D37A596|nr:SGNH/GDSL hydrolase family protein [Bosea sp. 124]PTM42497.1 lysophospholipase L1-like esterase [Bosea sp. 124]
MALAGSADLRCRSGAAHYPFQPVLPAAKAALRETGKLTIVALGSSTTAGSGASAEDRSYPAVLQEELRRRLPNADVRVVNKGVGGQSAYDMLLRMDGDVIEQKPSVVIWQTVVNEAISQMGEDKLAKILRKGIRKVQAASIDMVMMDLQWLPREGRYPRYDDYRAVLKKAADEYGVSVFPRYGMMKDWARSKRFTSEELVGMDGTHMVDAGYRCLAIRIADGIVGALTGAKPELADGSKATN